MLLDLFNINLRMFDGEGASGDGAASGANAPSAPAKKAGEFDNVVYGKNPESQPAEDEGNNSKNTESPRDYDKEFSELIKGEYKDAYKKMSQNLINSRFAKHKETENKLGKAERIVSIFAQKYGEYNVDNLIEKIENDETLFEKEAYENGYDPKQYMEINKIKAKAEADRQARLRAEQELFADRKYKAWIDEGKALKDKYPEFDLESELDNSQFKALLERGVPLEHAYFVLHKDEIIERNVQSAMQQGAKATAQNIAARGTRPKENAAGSATGLVYKSDVSSFTKKDRAEIAKRVARGERITF
jgi:hypothetical protein